MNRFELPPTIDARLGGQAERWRQRSQQKQSSTASAPFVTISRQYGCPAFSVASELADRLNLRLDSDQWAIYDRKLIEWITLNEDVEADLLHSLNEKTRNELEDWVVELLGGKPSQWAVFQKLARAARSLALKGRAIIIGRGGGMITHDLPGGIHVRMIAPAPWRLETLRQEWPERAASLTLEDLQKLDRERESFVRKFVGADPNSFDYYDLVLNAARLSVNQQADVISKLMVMI